jgi:hypothetical protein
VPEFWRDGVNPAILLAIGAFLRPPWDTVVDDFFNMRGPWWPLLAFLDIERV